MTLLSEVFRRPLDPGYQEAARRRATDPVVRRPQRVIVLVLALVLGLGVTTASLALRQPSAAAVEARLLLERQIAEQTARGDRAQQNIDDTSAALSTLQQQVLAEEDPALLSELLRDGGPSGVVAVHGPGLEIVLTDAPPADGAEEPDADHRVQDIDLQVLVNGLWDAGAEAVAVNGSRVTTTTAIRSAGSAVLVDLTALSSPYTVEALGEPASLQTRLALGLAGQHLATLRDTYNIGVQISAQRSLELPGTGQVSLRYASTPGMSSPAPSSGPGVAGSARS
jgi:uncharacterized protein YlxW (UPF0749 family)